MEIQSDQDYEITFQALVSFSKLVYICNHQCSVGLMNFTGVLFYKVFNFRYGQKRLYGLETFFITRVLNIQEIFPCVTTNLYCIITAQFQNAMCQTSF